MSEQDDAGLTLHAAFTMTELEAASAGITDQPTQRS